MITGQFSWSNINSTPISQIHPMPLMFRSKSLQRLIEECQYFWQNFQRMPGCPSPINVSFSPLTYWASYSNCITFNLKAASTTFWRRKSDCWVMPALGQHAAFTYIVRLYSPDPSTVIKQKKSCLFEGGIYSHEDCIHSNLNCCSALGRFWSSRRPWPQGMEVYALGNEPIRLEGKDVG